jgi:hypothetical protein
MQEINFIQELHRLFKIQLCSGVDEEDQGRVRPSGHHEPLQGPP